MARRMAEKPGAFDVRAEVIAHLRSKAERDPRIRCGLAGEGFVSPYTHDADRLEAGEVERFPKYGLPQSVWPFLPPGDGNAWYEVGADGSLARVDGPFRSEPSDG